MSASIYSSGFSIFTVNTTVDLISNMQKDTILLVKIDKPKLGDINSWGNLVWIKDSSEEKNATWGGKKLHTQLIYIIMVKFIILKSYFLKDGTGFGY